MAGTIPMLSPHAGKWGDASPPIDTSVCMHISIDVGIELRIHFHAQKAHH